MADISEHLNIVFNGQKHGLRFFENAEIDQLVLRENDEGRIEVFCLQRQRWYRAKPEEIVRQLFLIWIRDELGYPMSNVGVEWKLQQGSDSDKERIDIVVFTDETKTEPYIVFELKRPASIDGLEQLRSYLRWTGCYFGCWSNGDDHSFQLREEDLETKKGPYRYRDIGRIPRFGESLEEILKPLTYVELQPVQDMRDLIQRLEHDALANAGVNAFDELFKLIFAKLHDEFDPKSKPSSPVKFRVPKGTPDQVYKHFNDLFQAAKNRPHWKTIFDEGEVLKLSGDALKLCAAALEPVSLGQTDLDAVDAAFEYLVNPEQKGQKGQYFTPRPVIKVAVRMIAPDLDEKVIDPACGSAGFLIHTIKYIQEKYDLNRDAMYKYANDYVYAVDFDDRLKKVAKTMMIIAGDGKANVFGVNSLDHRAWQASPAREAIGEFRKDVHDGDFDIVLTNPLFSGKISNKSQLSAFDLYELAREGKIVSDDEADDASVEFSAPKKKVSVTGLSRDVLFIERSLDLLKPGGRMAVVLPQGNLNNYGTSALRDYLFSRARLLAVIGLPYNTFKPFTNTKTSLVLLQKNDGVPVKDDYDVFMAVSDNSGKNNRGEYVYRRNDAGVLIDEAGVPITESRRPPAVDHDLDDIADAFIAWGRAQGFGFLFA